MAVLGIAGIAQAETAKPPLANATRIAGDLKKTRFVADISSAVGFNVYILPKPYRVMIDLPEVVFDLPKGAGNRVQGLISQYRYGLLEPGRSRIVLETKGPVLIDKSFALPGENGKPARIVVDLVKTDSATFARLYKSQTPPVPPPPKKSSRAQPKEPPADEEKPPLSSGEKLAAGDIVLPRRKPKRDKPQQTNQPKVKRVAGAKPVIVIDPGHGGVDSGAVSRRRKTEEKKVVLAFSKIFAKKLRATGRYRVFMTREDDRFLTLRDRVKFARSHQADLFVAIHADSLKRGSASGATVYTLSEKASDAEADALARSENQADIIDGVDLGAANEQITGILIDLAQRETKNHSVFFAGQVVENLKTSTKLHRRPLRSAGFRVLKAPDVPSILLELGYLSSRQDEKKLLSSKWRARVAGSLVKAVDRYFATQLAAKE